MRQIQLFAPGLWIRSSNMNRFRRGIRVGQTMGVHIGRGLCPLQTSLLGKKPCARDVAGGAKPGRGSREPNSPSRRFGEGRYRIARPRRETVKACSANAPVPVQRCGHAFKIEACDLCHVLANGARLFMALESSVRPGVICLETIEFLDGALPGKGNSFSAGTVLLPCD
jgi:hypothetical protein